VEMICRDEIVDLGGVVTAKLGRIESRQRPHRRSLLLEARPEFITGRADRGDRTHSGYYHSAPVRHRLFINWLLVSRSATPASPSRVLDAIPCTKIGPITYEADHTPTTGMRGPSHEC